MKRFEFIDITTADVAFLAFGRDLDELFENAALAMFEVMIDTKQVETKIERKIELNAHDVESLLFDWLNELLVFVDAENLAFNEFNVKIEKNNGYKLFAVCKGEEMDLSRHEVRTAVKACTYHKLEIKKEGKVWRAKVILDI